MSNHQTTIPKGALLRVLAEDGHKVEGTGEERMLKCPWHDDAKPSMSINVSKGVMHCHACGKSGNVITYLREQRGWEIAQVMRYLDNDVGWKSDRIDHARAYDSIEQSKRKRKAEGKDIPSSFDIVRKPDLLTVHDYHDAQGKLIVRVGRYSRGAKMMPHTVCPEGSEFRYWLRWPLSPDLPDENRMDKIMPYRLPELLQGKPTDPVWVVEGEKCVDAVLDTKRQSGKSPLCTTFWGGSSKSNIQKYDTAVLHGRPVVLIADTDDASREYMRVLGTFLHGKGCAVRYILPEGTGGWDIADVLYQDGWDGVNKWFGAIGVTQHDEVVQTEGADLTPPMEDTEQFRVLGLHDTQMVIQNKTSFKVMLIPPASINNEGRLLSIASNAWWESKGGIGQAGKRRQFADAIIQAAYSKGDVDMTNALVGRGACRYERQLAWNLGDRVATMDDNGLLTNEIGFSELNMAFKPGVRIATADDCSEGDEIARKFYEVVKRYRFETEKDARAFLGWAVTSLIGGVLDFRPMLWLIAPASTGKTFLLNDVLLPLLGNAVTFYEDTTEAGLAQSMAGEALPVMIDEFEAVKQTENVWKAILGTVRKATSGGGRRGRGSPGGSASVMSGQRFSMLCASVTKPVLSDADYSRFVIIKLSLVGVADWQGLKQDIKELTNARNMKILRTWIIQNTPKIAEQAAGIAESLSNRMDTRSSQIYGALTAGVAFLSGDATPIVYEVSKTDMSEKKHYLLDHMLGQRVRDQGDDVVLTSIMRVAYLSPGAALNEKHRAARVCRSYGISIEYDDDGSNVLLIAPTAPTFKALAKGTEHENIDFKDYLLSLEGAFEPLTASGAPRRILVGGTQRIVVGLGKGALVRLGLEGSEEVQDEESIPDKMLDIPD